MMERLFPLFEARSFLDTLDIGGGLAVAFVDEEEDLDPAPIGRGLAEMAERLGRRLQGLVEPGMYLMGPAGAVLTRVLRVREPHPGTDAVRLLLDASVNQWPGGTFWNAINPVRPLVDRPGPPRRTWLFGQTSMDVDRFGPPRLLPPLEEGDLLLIGNCGAYAAVRQTSFNELDPAAEVVLP
jgi:diaminopimelate decarboxylase